MFEFITKTVVAISLAIGSLFTPQIDAPIVPAQDQPIERDRIANRVEQLESQVETLGAYNPSGGGTYRLKTSIGTTNTTITLSSFKEPVSEVPYTMVYLNTTVAYGTLDPQNTTRSEFISFTGITQNADGSATLTGVTRGLARSYPFTASSTLRQAHSGQSIFILSDSPQHFNEYAVKQNNETITGQWTFSVFPITASTSFATESVVGTVELATGAEAASSTLSGGTGYRLALPASIATSTAPTSGQVIPVTGSDGKLDVNFIANFASTTTFQIGDTPILSIGKYMWSSTTVGTSTWVVPTGVKKVKVTVVGPGGGGGGSNSGSPGSGGGGGGGGGTAIKWYDVSATSVLQFHVGGVGEYSWFGGTYSSPVMQANAGATAGADSNGGNGGTATGGDLNFTGGDGASGPTTEELGGNGGSSLFGMGGGGAENNNPNGKSGKSIGGGGGGGADGGGGAGGAAGGIIIEY